MLTRFSFFVAMLAFGLVACEGPAGPMGPVGPQGETGPPKGPQGRSGIAAFTLIEETLDDDEWNERQLSPSTMTRTAISIE